MHLARSANIVHYHIAKKVLFFHITLTIASENKIKKFTYLIYLLNEETQSKVKLLATPLTRLKTHLMKFNQLQHSIPQ